MTAVNLYTMIMNISNIVNELEAAGMTLEIGDDFPAYRRMRNTQKERGQLFPMFDVMSSFVDASNGFWVCGFDDAGELVHTQAVRQMDLGQTTLSQHLRDHRHKYITPNSTPDVDRTFYSDLPILNQISGSVCYHGEFWLRGGKEGLRNQGFTALLSRIVFELTLKLWSPDYVFGLVPMPLALKGIPVRYGYSHCESGAWIGPDNELTSEETLVWMSRNDIHQFLESAPRSLSEERILPSRRELRKNMSIVA